MRSGDSERLLPNFGTYFRANEVTTMTVELFGSGDATETDPQPSLKDDVRTAARSVSLGLAAGGLGGLIAGGIGGRLGMYALRLTSDDSVRGIKSDDGFEIGRFDLASTLELFFETMFLGSTFGLIVVLGRIFLKSRWMPLAWASAGASVGGAVLIHGDGVDFKLLEPHWFAVALFIAIPAAGGGLIAWLVERIDGYWWKKPAASGATALAMLPAVVFLPVLLVASLGGAISVLAMRVPGLRNAPEWRITRRVAAGAFAAVTGLGGLGLIGDLQAVL